MELFRKLVGVIEHETGIQKQGDPFSPAVEHARLLGHHGLLEATCHHSLLLHHHLLLLHLALLHHLLLLHQLLLSHRLILLPLSQLLHPGRVLLHRHRPRRGLHSLVDQLLACHHVLLPHLVHLHPHLHLPLAHHHHLGLVRVRHRLHLARHGHRYAHTLHHELLILHGLHQVHLPRLLHHVVSLHLLSDHLLPHELLLHRILLHHHRRCRIVRLHVSHLPNVTLLHELLHRVTLVTALDNFELVAEHLRLLLAVFTLLFKMSDLHIEQSHLALLVGEWVRYVVAFSELRRPALVRLALQVLLIACEAFVPVRLQFLPYGRRQAEAADKANNVRNDHHVGPDVVEICRLHLLVLLGCSRLRRVEGLRRLLLLLVVDLRRRLLGFFVLLLSILVISSVLNLSFELVHQFVLLYAKLGCNILHEYQGSCSLYQNDERHQVGEESAECSGQHLWRLVLSQKHVLLHVVVQEGANEADGNGERNDWPVEEAGRDQSEILRQVVRHIDL